MKTQLQSSAGCPQNFLNNKMQRSSRVRRALQDPFTSSCDQGRTLRKSDLLPDGPSVCDNAVSHQQYLYVTQHIEGVILDEKNPHHFSRSACTAPSLVSLHSARGSNSDPTLSSLRVNCRVYEQIIQAHMICQQIFCGLLSSTRNPIKWSYPGSDLRWVSPLSHHLLEICVTPSSSTSCSRGVSWVVKEGPKLVLRDELGLHVSSSLDFRKVV